jgi:hypothetical protein
LFHITLIESVLVFGVQENVSLNIQKEKVVFTTCLSIILILQIFGSNIANADLLPTGTTISVGRPESIQALYVKVLSTPGPQTLSYPSPAGKVLGIFTTVTTYTSDAVLKFKIGKFEYSKSVPPNSNIFLAFDHPQLVSHVEISISGRSFSDDATHVAYVPEILKCWDLNKSGVKDIPPFPGGYVDNLSGPDDLNEDINNDGKVNTLDCDSSTALFCGKPISEYNVINGTVSNDKLAGTSENDLIRGFGGNDLIKGNAGDDCLIGGAGWDAIDGGIGDDRIKGGTGNDALSGGIGNDRIDGGSGTDIADGGFGSDMCVNVEKSQNCES